MISGLRTQSMAKVSGLTLSPAGLGCVKWAGVESGREHGHSLSPTVLEAVDSQMPHCSEMFVLNKAALITHFV